jgi:hypothetical protein
MTTWRIHNVHVSQKGGGQPPFEDAVCSGCHRARCSPVPLQGVAPPQQVDLVGGGEYALREVALTQEGVDERGLACRCARIKSERGLR